jgi:UDP-N-acetylglucosamine transferase subunit ALG13
LIFVTTGSAVKGIEFTRLVKKMDEVAENINEEVIMQIGAIPYEPRHTKYFRYASYQENLSYFQKASLIVGHCGIGTILNALKFQKPIIVVPRRIKLGELNRDDHQMEIAKVLEKRGYQNIYIVYEEDQLEEKIMEVLKRKEIVQFDNREREDLIKKIKEFIETFKG